MAHLLDSNVLITAKRVHYGFDFCPGFRDWIVAEHAEGKVYSIERVYDELKGQNDDLAAWVRALPGTFFLTPDAATVPHFTAVSAWTSGRNYRTPAINDFLQTADFHLVSQARQGGHTVVTYEVPVGLRKPGQDSRRVPRSWNEQRAASRDAAAETGEVRVGSVMCQCSTSVHRRFRY